MPFFTKPFWSSDSAFYINQYYFIHVPPHKTKYFLRYPTVTIVGAWLNRGFASHLRISATEEALSHQLLLLWQILSPCHLTKSMEEGWISAFSSRKTNLLCGLAFHQLQQHSRRAHRAAQSISNKEEQKEHGDFRPEKAPSSYYHPEVCEAQNRTCHRTVPHSCSVATPNQSATHTRAEASIGNIIHTSIIATITITQF